jgi:ABC-type glycerol-3-phosphate transport system substrate-binding protein
MNKLQIIIFAFAIIMVIVGVIAFSLTGDQEPPLLGSTGVLKVWGLEDEAFFKSSFKEYQGEFNVSIDYRQKDIRTFRQELIEALASDRAPDAVFATADWIISNKDKLTTMPATIATTEDVKRTYVDLVDTAFIETRQIDGQLKSGVWAFPLWIDPLVLYWNKDLFNAKRLALPPENWTKFIEISNDLRQIDGSNNVLQAGSALGRANNIPLFKQIFTLILLQQNASLEDALYGGTKRLEAESAIRFYTDFGNPSNSKSGVYTWNTRLPEPRDLFIEGKLGMMLDYHSYRSELREKNPHISFDIALAPQIENTQFPVHFADIRGVAVLKRSTQVLPAWHFASWITARDRIITYLGQTSVAPARRDLLQEATFPVVLKESSLNAKRSREEFPELNASLIKDIIEMVSDGRLTPSEALTDAKAKYDQYLQSIKQ